MDYTLAKELKDNGFEFHRDGYTAFANEDFFYKLPSLSELIESCGDISLVGCKDDWSVYDSVNPDSGFEVKRIGHTPEEAVARLWLELNKKKQ